jgi:hypothetical protein
MEKIQAMKQYTTVMGNLLSPLSRYEFQKSVEKYDGDKGIRTMSTWNEFAAGIYGQVTGAFGVREIVNSLSANSAALYHCGMAAVKRSTFCDALEKRDQQIFKDVLDGVIEKAQNLAGRSGQRFHNPLKIIDSTTIPLGLAFKDCDWAKFRAQKGGLKLHTKFSGDSFLPVELIPTEAKKHDSKCMAQLCSKGRELYTFDRGYCDFSQLYNIHLNESQFVTRLKSNAAYEAVKTISKSDTEAVRSDEIIRLTGKKASKTFPARMRKVTYHDAEHDRDFVFITNCGKQSAQEIADIYKARWQIELFFKWIKQNLKIKTFWGTSENAVLSQIWFAMIVMVLTWIHSYLSTRPISPHEIMQLLKTMLLHKGSVADLLVLHFKPPSPPPQLSLSLFSTRRF